MKIVLLESVRKLGSFGQIVDVKRGYAVNYLLPQKKALLANDNNLKYFEEQKAKLAAKNMKDKEAAQAVASKVDNTNVVVIRQARETGQLYGAVRNRDISDALSAMGFVIETRHVELSDPIKHLGIHRVRLNLHSEVMAHVNVNIAQSEEHAAAEEKSQTKAQTKSKKSADVAVEETALEAVAVEESQSEEA